MSNVTPAAVTAIAELSAFRLASIAEVLNPDTAESAGASFLDSVRTRFVEMLDEQSDALDGIDDADDIRDALDDAIHEGADGAVPIYTHTMWSTFVDLGAYREDVSDLMEEGDAEKFAQVALYLIASRLMGLLVDEYAEALSAE